MLYKLQGKALFRRMTRNVGSVKGAFFFLISVAVICVWIAPSAWQAMKMPRSDPKVAIDAAPVIMLAMGLLSLVTSAGEKAIIFSPAEVDFLFSGPFTRRQLLAYKIGKNFAGIFFSSFLMSVFLLRYATSWPIAWLGLFLAVFFMQMLSMAMTLISQSAGERAYTRSRKFILTVIVLVVAAAMIPHLKGGGRMAFYEMAKSLQASRVGSTLLAPLTVFGRLFASANWQSALIYAAAALGMNLVLFFIVFYLDADYLEAAATKSQVLHARAQRMRKGGISAFSAPAKKTKWTIPRFPYLAGAGPIAWRQATTALRNSRGILISLGIMTISVGPIMFAPGNVDSKDGALIGTVASLTLVVAAWLRFDFRGDLDLLDHLKSLPVSASAISAGQLITPTLMMTVCHLVIMTSVALMSVRASSPVNGPVAQNPMPILLSAALISFPFNTILFAVENFIFLIFPTRATASPGDFQGYGRQILMFFAKVSILLVATAVAGIPAFIVHKITGSLTLSVATATIILSGLALATIPAVAWSFKRFDVSGDVPA